MVTVERYWFADWATGWGPAGSLVVNMMPRQLAFLSTLTGALSLQGTTTGSRSLVS